MIDVKGVAALMLSQQPYSVRGRLNPLPPPTPLVKKLNNFKTVQAMTAKHSNFS